MPTSTQAARRVTITLAAAIATSVGLSACATGERPTLVAAPVVSDDDSAVAAVVERLDRAETATFTATYDIIPSATGVVTQATVVAADGRRRVQIGDVDYIVDRGVSRTCDLALGECVDFTDDARISDLNITSEFWGDAFAARLRLDGSRRIGFSQGRVETIAGQTAACVDVPLPAAQALTAAVTYCALDLGVLARYFGADVSIELTSFLVGAEPDDLAG